MNSIFISKPVINYGNHVAVQLLFYYISTNTSQKNPHLGDRLKVTVVTYILVDCRPAYPTI